MFTGLIAERGSVSAYEQDGAGATLTISAALASQLREGDSVAVNGVCLTATSVQDQGFQAEAMLETLERSSLGQLRPGAHVNLELPLRAEDRLGGHVVQGHVDAIGEVTAAPPDLEVRIPPDLIRYCVEKGSVAIDGVSLTIFDIRDDSFSIAVIPHTSEVTTIGRRRPGDKVNVEVDVAAKQIEKLLSPYLAKLS